MYNTGASTHQEIIHAGASIAMPTGKRTIEPGIIIPVKITALGKVMIPNSPPVNTANVSAPIHTLKVRRKTPIKYINGDAKSIINGTDGYMMNNAIIASIDDMVVLALSVDIFDRDSNCPIILSFRRSLVPGLVMLVTINVVTAAGNKNPIMKKKIPTR
mmetsp:Transcript_21874/g.30652  ORF Transcript_21874/g.30652 Transcript_21874/m.30652 type:complete len:159 (+) Transcript_21874:693-1169(+)